MLGQQVVPRKCDLCDERSTSMYQIRDKVERLCDKHHIAKYGNNGMDWDKWRKRREELRGRIASIIENNTSPLVLEPGRLTSSDEIAEKIMKGFGL